MKKNSIVAVLDIGSSKIACAIGNYNYAKNKTDIVSFAHQMSKGVKHGRIVNVDEAANVIIEVLSTAEEASRYNIENIIVSVSGGKIVSEVVMGSLNINNQQIKEKDLKRLIKNTLDRINQEEYDILHYIPAEFKVDNISGVTHPIGMVCKKLSAYLNVILVPTSIINNLENCLSKCQLNISDLVVSTYAAGLGVLTQEEKEQGVILIDFGASATSVSVYSQGMIKAIKIIPIGSEHVTKDIAAAFGIHPQIAEKIKIIYGNLDTDQFNYEKIISLSEIDSLDNEQVIEYQSLYEVIIARIDEITEYILKGLLEEHNNYYYNTINQVVITGGGAKLNGLDKYLKYKLDKRVSVGYTNYLPAMDNNELDLLYGPEFANLIGLINYFTKKQILNYELHVEKQTHTTHWLSKLFKIFTKI
ncbi:cell division protein FtsA [Rickettsiales endosymbiont of Stachyamoeba lipophora]|uniref:cell division protein FtsA n=1 Tax=Rickettsiales endosymbiont of Stachyamoeba lipophora TaxID=2486578 RepID=UPI000F64EB1B|nr:cell division protein FtsA [Rickettsiales endosymbiont of Stachyamoeba lipophora]AZL15466.1 cell division protein FtsA [Rickettsiales endosymbiont of Stachyamoeba lipophora]